MDILFTNARAVLPNGEAKLCDVAVADGRFAEIGTQLVSASDMLVIDCHGQWLAPGLFDIQVNGGGGVLFNDEPTPEGLRAICDAHAKLGTRWLLPTLISDHLDVVDAGMRAVEQSILAGNDRILGIHIEGPFLNPERSGIHDPARMGVLDGRAIALLSSLKVGKTLVTLAPEQTTLEAIRKLVANGVTVSLGHSNATYQQAADALHAGASGFTHLFNAMSPLQTREPGLVGAALENQTGWSSIILDGHHVSPVTLDIAFKSRPIDRFILITDAMSPAGTDLETFVLQGREISVMDGTCRDENGTLAGAYLSLPEAISNAVSNHDIAPEAAIRMASQFPAAFLFEDHALPRIEVNAPANGVLLSTDFKALGELRNGHWVSFDGFMGPA